MMTIVIIIIIIMMITMIIVIVVQPGARTRSQTVCLSQGHGDPKSNKTLL